MHLVEGLTVGDGEFAFIFVGVRFRVGVLSTLGVFGGGIAAVAWRHKRLVLGVGAGEADTSANAHLLNWRIFNIQLLGERYGAAVSVAVLGSVVERVGCLDIVVIFKPFLHLAIFVVFLIIRVGVGIVHECHSRVAS